MSQNKIVEIMFFLTKQKNNKNKERIVFESIKKEDKDEDKEKEPSFNFKEEDFYLKNDFLNSFWDEFTK